MTPSRPPRPCRMRARVSEALRNLRRRGASRGGPAPLQHGGQDCSAGHAGCNAKGQSLKKLGTPVSGLHVSRLYHTYRDGARMEEGLGQAQRCDPLLALQRLALRRVPVNHYVPWLQCSRESPCWPAATAFHSRLPQVKVQMPRPAPIIHTVHVVATASALNYTSTNIYQHVKVAPRVFPCQLCVSRDALPFPLL